MNETPKIAVLLPCRDEAGAVGNVIHDIHTLAPEYKIYVCDNASADDTADAAERAGARVIMEERTGKGHAMNALLRYVTADCYIMCDGDDTYDVSDIVDMADLILDGYDLVTGDRLKGNYYATSVQSRHKLGNRFINRVTKILYGPGVDDVLSGYRAMSRAFVCSLPPFKGGFSVEVELSAHALLCGVRMTNIPVDIRERAYGKSKIKFSDGLELFGELIRMRFSKKKKCEKDWKKEKDENE